MERGWESGDASPEGWIPDTSLDTLALLKEEADASRVAAVRSGAEALFESLAQRPELASQPFEVRLTEALVRDDVADARCAAPRPLVTAQVSVGPDGARPRWSRVTRPEPAPGRGIEWPGPFVDAFLRGLRAAEAPVDPGKDPRRNAAALVLDAFAFADLVRAASRSWRSGSRGRALPVSAGLELDEGELLAGSARLRPALRRGVLVDDPESLGIRTRASWRERPRLDWRGLVARLPELERAPIEPGTLLVSTLHLLPGVLLGSGIFLDDGGCAWSAPLLPLPPAETLLGALKGQIGRPALDLTGLPVQAPPALVRREALFSRAD